jgi:aminoglycoside phosphotransferase family enzyme
VAFLSDTASYGNHLARVEVIETHFAWVFLAGDRAYKLKKPTQLRGADWRTTPARERACQEELELNRQLSPATYLGIEPLVQTPAGLRIGGQGPPVDWLVVMRRLDPPRMLDSVLGAQAVTRRDLDSVLRFLVNFYQSQTPEPLAPQTYLRRITMRMEEALAALQRPERGLPVSPIERLTGELHTIFASLRAQLAVRADGQRIVEAHGDLRAEHIFLGPPVQMIDRLEVYGELRRLDPAEEVAMLALECERAFVSWAPAYVRDRYRSLAADPCSDELFAFYTALRALTQAKLAIWHLDDPEQFPDAEPWRRRALTDVESALRHIRCAVGDPSTVR